MDQIRFNQPSMSKREPERPLYEAGREAPKSGAWKLILKTAAALLIAGAVFAGFWLVKDNLFGGAQATEEGASGYSAIFMSNGQVYFGKLMSKGKSEFVLSNVYYLQLSENGTTSAAADAKFSLVKLGNEVHGPTDKLFINTANILFYETLRSDSQVVKSIESKSK